MTQKQFAQKCGISTRAVSDIEKGKQGLQSKTLSKIIKAFNIDSNWLLGWAKRVPKVPMIIAEKGAKYGIKELIAIPIINEVPAGYPTYPDIDDFVSTYIYLPAMPKKAFGLFVNGKSMEPEIFDGDIVILNPSINSIKKGELGVFRVNMDVSLKRFMPDKKKGAYLMPSNPDFAPIYVSEDDECELIGKVIYKILKCK